eukprot:355754-Chlamydomonas_euryale.AAC.18
MLEWTFGMFQNSKEPPPSKCREGWAGLQQGRLHVVWDSQDDLAAPSAAGPPSLSCDDCGEVVGWKLNLILLARACPGSDAGWRCGEKQAEGPCVPLNRFLHDGAFCWLGGLPCAQHRTKRIPFSHAPQPQ